MNARNESGPVADLRPVDVGAESQDAAPEPGQRQRTDAAAEREERKLDAAVRRVAEQARARRPGHDPSIRITHVDPALLVPS